MIGEEVLESPPPEPSRPGIKLSELDSTPEAGASGDQPPAAQANNESAEEQAPKPEPSTEPSASSQDTQPANLFDFGGKIGQLKAAGEDEANRLRLLQGELEFRRKREGQLQHQLDQVMSENNRQPGPDRERSPAGNPPPASTEDTRFGETLRKYVADEDYQGLGRALDKASEEERYARIKERLLADPDIPLDVLRTIGRDPDIGKKTFSNQAKMFLQSDMGIQKLPEGEAFDSILDDAKGRMDAVLNDNPRMNQQEKVWHSQRFLRMAYLDHLTKTPQPAADNNGGGNGERGADGKFLKKAPPAPLTTGGSAPGVTKSNDDSSTKPLRRTGAVRLHALT